MSKTVNYVFMTPFWLLKLYPDDEKCKLFFMSPFWLLEPYPGDKKCKLFGCRGGMFQKCETVDKLWNTGNAAAAKAGS